MSARFLVRLTSCCVVLALFFVGIVSAWGMLEVRKFQYVLNPPMQYDAPIRLPDPPVPPPDRSNEGPDFGSLQPGTGEPATQFTGSWSRFRGDNFDAIATESPPLVRPNPNGPPPKVLWQLELGPGYAGAAIRNGCAFVLDYDIARRRDTLRCLSLENGEEIWNYSYPVKIPENHGVSRTIPALTDEFCVTLGPLCHVGCFDPKTGKLLWSRDMVQEYGTVVPQWYAGQCPLIARPLEKDWAILAPCGPETLMVAVDCETGEDVWKTPNPFGWSMTHTSIFPMKLGELDTFVYVGKEGIVGVDAKTGTILWANFEWKIGMATCPSPLVLPGDRVFLCGGYNEPCAMLQIAPSQGNAQTPFEAKLLWKQKPSIFGSEQQTPLFFEGHIFGIRKWDRKFACITLDGKVRWYSGPKAADLGSLGASPYMIAGDMFLLLSDEGRLTFAEATTEEFRPIAAFEVIPDAAEAWAPMAFADGLLLLRDISRMYCLDLR